MTKVPLPSTSARVLVALSSTTVSLGGAKSSAQAQAVGFFQRDGSDMVQHFFSL